MLDSPPLTSADPISLAQSAASWLSRIRYQVRPQAPVFGPNISTYHEMADPKAPLEIRLAASRRMLEAVQQHIVVEQVKAADRFEPHSDPYGIEFRTTQRGAILEMIAAMLEKSIAMEHRKGH